MPSKIVHRHDSHPYLHKFVGHNDKFIISHIRMMNSELCLLILASPLFIWNLNQMNQLPHSKNNSFSICELKLMSCKNWTATQFADISLLFF
mgnify:CR=1 FL=1